MDGERYPGERQALIHFLIELRPLVGDALGVDAILYHRIDRALKTAELASLRNARQIFHNQPDALKQSLLRSMLSRPKEVPRKARLLERYAERTPATFVRFEVFPEADAQTANPEIALTHELLDEVPVQVLVRPGTLPSAAAASLRAIAERLESDRRLLSERHWRQPPAFDHGDQRVAADKDGSSADEA